MAAVTCREITEILKRTNRKNRTVKVAKLFMMNVPFGLLRIFEINLICQRFVKAARTATPVHTNVLYSARM